MFAGRKIRRITQCGLGNCPRVRKTSSIFPSPVPATIPLFHGIHPHEMQEAWKNWGDTPPTPLMSGRRKILEFSVRKKMADDLRIQ
jgi:hypothetical protein